MVDRQVVIEYLNNFRRLLSKYLKSGVGVQTTSYPFEGGVIMVVELGSGIVTKDENRTKSNNLKEALHRTNLFEEADFVPEIPGTSILLSMNKIVILKTTDSKQWSEDSAKADITNVINAIRNKQQNK